MLLNKLGNHPVGTRMAMLPSSFENHQCYDLFNEKKEEKKKSS